MEYVVVILLILVLVVLIYQVASKSRSTMGEVKAQDVLLQQQLEALRSDVSQSLKNTSDAMRDSIQHTTDIVFKSLQSTTETVNQQLSIVTNQLSSVTHQLQNNTGQVGTRLDTAAKVIQDVQNKLGELGKATQEIKELGQSVSKLEEMLRAPKLRGGLGELLLADLLKQVLPTGTYDVQYKFRNGQTVDAIIHTAGGKVPVDSKFPLENFRKMVDAKTDQEKRTSYRTFASDVKKHIDAIAEKYIVPDEGTFDFALMYIPAENIYYETIIKDESFGEENGLYSYSTSKHVVPVSPNSFYAHLRVIALGFKGLQIEQSAKVIYQNLQRLSSELQKFTDLFDTLGTQLSNAKNNFDKADKQLSAFTERLKGVQSLPAADDGKQLNILKGE